MSEADMTIHYPSILFRVGGELCSADSKYISTILELPKYQTLPNTPNFITGIFPYRNGSVTMFDLRTALDMPTLEAEYAGFVDMLDNRKQDHIKWVTELERCIKEDDTFTLATDPHKCALGRWYDQYEPKSHALKHHMDKLNVPHQRLHHAALEVASCKQNHTECIRETCLKALLQEVQEDCVPEILHILDEAKEIFKSAVYHEMVLVLEGDTTLGMVVDEVLSVEDLVPEEHHGDFERWHFTPYVKSVVSSPNYDELIAQIDMPYIISTGDRMLRQKLG